MYKYLSLILFFLLSNSQNVHAEKIVSQAHPQYNKFSEQLTALKKDNQILGMSAAVIQGNQIIWSQGYGFVDKARTVPMTTDTPMWIASITKTFVGLAFLKLEAEGLIDLTELASKTPGFTGLCQWLSSSTIPFGKDLNCQSSLTIKNILNHQVNGEPGTGFLYNPIMYSRLSRYLEHKFGSGIDAVKGRHNYLGQTIDRTILHPAGMHRSMSSQWDREKPMVYFDMATGYTVKDGGYAGLPRPERHIAGGAGIISTVSDLAKYDMALNSGLIADKQIKERLFAPATFNNGQPSPYGYGWYFEEYHGQKLMWHSGWDEEAGYSSLYLKIPEKNLTFIILANGEGIWWSNPLDKAEVHKSSFARAFLDTFLKNS